MAVFAFSIPLQASALPIFLESGGQVVVEAETFSARTSVPEASWLIVPDESAGVPAQFTNFRGPGYIQALPDNSGASGAQGVPPFVDYTIRLTSTGEYRLFVRFDGFNDNSDTFFANVLELSDGTGGSIADWYRYVRITDDQNFATTPWAGSAGFERTDSPFTDGETPAVWTIAAAGDYTLRFDMREDGMAIDAFVFQLSSLAAPTGVGPPPSAIVPEPTTMVLLGSGIAILAATRRRARRAG